MYAISVQDVQAAKLEDLTGTAARSRLIAAFEDRITYLAGDASSDSYQRHTQDAQDYAQEARLALWSAFTSFSGTSEGEFVKFAERTIRGAISNARRAQGSEGVSQSTMRRFEMALRAADGSAHEAEVLAQDPDVMGAECLSAEMAYAARLAYEGSDRLDAPVPGESGMALIDVVADRLGIPADLLESDDITRAQVGITRDRVHAILSELGEKQRTVLKGLVGIDPVGHYGTENDNALAADHGLNPARVKKIRSEGKSTFARRWVTAYGEWA